MTITSFALFTRTVWNKIKSYQARKLCNRVGSGALIVEDYGLPPYSGANNANKALIPLVKYMGLKD